MADPEPGSIVVVIGEPLGHADVPLLCARLRTLLERSDADLVVCDLAALAHADLGTATPWPGCSSPPDGSGAASGSAAPPPSCGSCSPSWG